MFYCVTQARGQFAWLYLKDSAFLMFQQLRYEVYTISYILYLERSAWSSSF